MENMDKGLTVPKWVLIVWPKIPQMPQNLSATFVCPSSKVLDFNEKRLHLDVRSPWTLVLNEKVQLKPSNFELKNRLNDEFNQVQSEKQYRDSGTKGKQSSLFLCSITS